jgi:hypothetical protein
MESYRGAEKAQGVFWFEKQCLQLHVDVRQFLGLQFPDRWMWQAAPISWPPPSPGLTPIYFFLCEFIKDHVYEPLLPTHLQKLKDRITTAIATVNQIYCRERGKRLIISGMSAA